MSQLNWEYKMTLFFLLCSAVLTLLLGIEWWYGRSFREEMIRDIFSVEKASFEMQPVPEYPFVQQPVESYADFVDRPIFFEGRKPIAKVVDHTAEMAAAQPVAKAPVAEFDLLLTGIVNTPKGIRVLFQNPKVTVYADKFKKATKGDEINGWKLVEIQSDKVVMQADDQTKEVLLLKAKPKLPIGTQPVIQPNPNPFNIQPPQPPQPKK